ncbi:unnamed protein product [Calypogeia fissa]
MAFTSKVVILLFVSSLTWWQVSALSSSAKIIIEHLNNITTMTKALATEVKSISKSNVEVNGPRVVDLIKNVTQAYVRANSSLNTVSHRLETNLDAKAILDEALRNLVKAQEKSLTPALVDQKRFLVRYRPSILPALVSLRDTATQGKKGTKGIESYGEHLFKVLPTNYVQRGHVLVSRLDYFIGKAVATYRE